VLDCYASGGALHGVSKNATIAKSLGVRIYQCGSGATTGKKMGVKPIFFWLLTFGLGFLRSARAVSMGLNPRGLSYMSGSMGSSGRPSRLGGWHLG